MSNHDDDKLNALESLRIAGPFRGGAAASARCGDAGLRCGAGEADAGDPRKPVGRTSQVHAFQQRELDHGHPPHLRARHRCDCAAAAAARLPALCFDRHDAAGRGAGDASKLCSRRAAPEPARRRRLPPKRAMPPPMTPAAGADEPLPKTSDAEATAGSRARCTGDAEHDGGAPGATACGRGRCGAAGARSPARSRRSPAEAMMAKPTAPSGDQFTRFSRVAGEDRQGRAGLDLLDRCRHGLLCLCPPGAERGPGCRSPMRCGSRS